MPLFTERPERGGAAAGGGKRSREAYESDLSAPYVLYGTPLPPLDPDVRDDGSYVPIWQQEVRDERGRKRLHGAFTGGFSAGYALVRLSLFDSQLITKARVCLF
jgi:hypothetical protein